MRKLFNAILSLYCRIGEHLFLPAKLFVELIDKLTDK